MTPDPSNRVHPARATYVLGIVVLTWLGIMYTRSFIMGANPVPMAITVLVFALTALAELRSDHTVGAEVIDVPATTAPASLHASERLASAHDPLEERHQP